MKPDVTATEKKGSIEVASGGFVVAVVKHGEKEVASRYMEDSNGQLIFGGKRYALVMIPINGFYTIRWNGIVDYDVFFQQMATVFPNAKFTIDVPFSYQKTMQGIASFRDVLMKDGRDFYEELRSKFHQAQIEMESLTAYSPGIEVIDEKVNGHNRFSARDETGKLTHLISIFKLMEGTMIRGGYDGINLRKLEDKVMEIAGLR